MFLDINMPGASGLQLAEALNRLKYPPAIVFVTAYSEHAAKAFDVNAVDYLVKPVETDRYLSTVSLAQLEARLEPCGFFRVHRRYLVNLACVEEVTPVSGGTLLLTLSGEDENIPVSRRRVASLKKALGL
jgi:DNA-binding LytR/AlgR family response regulator